MKRGIVGLIAASLLATAIPYAALAAQVSGAIFTTESACDGTNVNIFGAQDEVYLDGGPAHPGAAGLPDGEYFVQVTEPDGTLLGTSVGAVDPTPAVVVNGEFVDCYQLSAILLKASDASIGYDATSNSGGEYKVWASQNSTFPNDETKTDNFKVKAVPGGGEPDEATLNVIKFYDANANGLNDDGIEIDGWRILIEDGTDYVRFTPVSIVVDPDDYAVTEGTPLESNWVQTAGLLDGVAQVTINPVSVSLLDGDEKTVEFGNVCLGAGGGHTLGFWSNKNGERRINDDGGSATELALLSGLNLKNAIGTDFNPTSYSAFRTWLLNATATNMAYMLSAQLAAMELNVEALFVDEGALVYAPDVMGSDALGFISISDLMDLADDALAADGFTPSGDPNRGEQEDLKDAMDDANNNLNFVQSAPCAFSFADQ